MVGVRSALSHLSRLWSRGVLSVLLGLVGVGLGPIAPSHMCATGIAFLMSVGVGVGIEVCPFDIEE